MSGSSGEWLVGLVSALAVLFLIGRGLPLRRWVPVLAVTLAVVLIVVLAERSGVWPEAWRFTR